jgi:hypothetical protein
VQILHVAHHRFKHAVSVACLVGHYCKAELTSLPLVLVTNLSDGDVELRANPTKDALHHLPLGFERRGIVSHEVNNAHANHHMLTSPGSSTVLQLH